MLWLACKVVKPSWALDATHDAAKAFTTRFQLSEEAPKAAVTMTSVFEFFIQ